MLRFAGVPFLGGVMGVIAIIVNVSLDIVLAIPFWLFWTVFGIGTKYFSFLPSIYQSITLWHCMGIFACIGLIRMLIMSKNIKVNVKE